jgi:hypothetical protein
MTAGASAFHALDPSEQVMRMEEMGDSETVEKDRDALRVEIFSGFAAYLFADGPEPAAVRARIEGFFRSFHETLADKMRGPVVWVAPEKVAEVLARHGEKLAEVKAAARSRGALSTWWAELETEVDIDFVRSCIVGLIELLVSQGRTWRLATGTAYCLAKAFRPQLIAGMSLDDIAKLSGDAGGRATPCNRTKRIYNRRVAAAGALGSYVHFQKSAEAVARYSEAQKGNKNRKMKRAVKRKGNLQ